MFHNISSQTALVTMLFTGIVGCQGSTKPPNQQDQPGQGADVKAFEGARIIDGTGSDPIENGILVVRDGRIDAVGPSESTAVPDGAQPIDVAGRTIIPGIIVTHGHVGGTKGLESSPDNYTEENVLSQPESLRPLWGNHRGEPGQRCQSRIGSSGQPTHERLGASETLHRGSAAKRTND